MSRLPNRRVSIKDVASAAGVSLQTVSRVVNESEQVAGPTRERVLQVIKDLGYRRNELARNLIQGRSRTLGVVSSGLDYFGGRQVNAGITVEAEALGYSLLLKEHHTGDTIPTEDFIQSLLDRQVDGILWMLSNNSSDHEPVLAKMRREYNLPVVALVKSHAVGVPCSAFDNYAAGVMATRHLIERGRRNIVHIAGPESSWDALERVRAWRATMLEAGLEAGDERFFHGNWSPDTGEAGMLQLLEHVPQVDAVFAGNDNMALGAMLVAHRMGKRIPQDIAFVGVDGAKGTGWFHPPLTTIRQDRVSMGKHAVHMLTELIEAKFSGRPIPDIPNFIQPPELIVRESSQT